MPALPQSLLRAVQHNCDVSDAQHAGSYTLCIYLMHMREYFRWHEQLGLEAVLGAAKVGEWVDCTRTAVGEPARGRLSRAANIWTPSRSF